MANFKDDTANLMCLIESEGHWIQSLILVMSDKSIRSHEKVFQSGIDIDTAVEWRINHLFGTQDDTRGIASLLACVFSSTTHHELVWFGMGYLGEIIKCMRGRTLDEFQECKAINSKFRFLLWNSTRKVFKLTLSHIIFVLHALTKDFELAKRMTEWSDVVFARTFEYKPLKSH